MKIYNSKLIYDYINGNDIVDYDIEELENDYRFMMKVIDCTKNKNMYNLCSDEVKKNYTFVKFMVEKFKDDVNFIAKIADYYLEQTNKDDITYRELNIIMDSIINTDIDSELLSYSISTFGFYNLELEFVKMACDIAIKENILDNPGLGYIFIREKYNDSEIIEKYFARKFVNEIFYNGEYTLEELLHSKVKDFEQLKKYGINKFLIDYIKNKDNCLSSYVSCNLDVLSELKNSLVYIEKNWNNYINRINYRKKNIFYQELSNYMEEHLYDIRYNVDLLIEYVVKKFNLQEIFTEINYDDHDYNPLEEIDEIYKDHEDFKAFSTIDKNVMNFEEYKCLQYTINLVKDLFKNDIIENDFNNYDTESNKQKCQILKYDFRKNKKL